jgi:hypothetical protein
MVALFAALLSAQSVDDVRARVGAYVSQFTPQFANVVALETYEQTTKAALTGVSSPGAAFGGPAPLATPVTWRFKADLLLVRYPLAELDWMMFRDVTEIDGERVRHEENRLMTLFAEPTIESAQRAARISQESLRYHVPGGSFAVTNPLLVLALMQTHYQDRLRFRLGGQERSLGPGVRVMAFEELESRASGSNSGTKEPAPPLLAGVGRVRGNVWVEVETGRIVKTEARIGDGTRGISTSITTFARDARLGLTVPVEMRTTWTYNREPVTGIATYSDFRRFEVRTDPVVVELPDEAPDQEPPLTEGGPERP